MEVWNNLHARRLLHFEGTECPSLMSCKRSQSPRKHKGNACVFQNSAPTWHVPSVTHSPTCHCPGSASAGGSRLPCALLVLPPWFQSHTLMLPDQIVWPFLHWFTLSMAWPEVHPLAGQLKLKYAPLRCAAEAKSTLVTVTATGTSDNQHHSNKPFWAPSWDIMGDCRSIDTILGPSWPIWGHLKSILSSS